MGPSDEKSKRLGSGGWPPWARGVVSALLILHLLAIVAVGLATPPSSPLERRVADTFLGYLQATDQAHAHRYYSAEPPPTPVVLAVLRFDDGRPEQTIRLPDREQRPRLRYQRELALAYHLSLDFEQARNHPDGPRTSLLAESYARHLCRSTPHCSGVTLSLRRHLIPDLAQYRSGRIDLESEEFYTVPERIGDFACDAP